MDKKLLINDEEVVLNHYKKFENNLEFSIDDTCFSAKLIKQSGDYLTINLNGKNISGYIVDGFLRIDGEQLVVQNYQKSRSKKANDDYSMNSPMPGKILKINCKAGDSVKKGDVLVIMEAMKMEHSLKANKDGVIKSVNCQVDQQVEGGIELVSLDQ